MDSDEVSICLKKVEDNIVKVITYAEEIENAYRYA